MLGEETSSTPVVQINGRPLTAEVAAKLTSATVDDSLGVPDMLVLRFLDDGAEVLGLAGVEIGTPVTLAVQQSGDGAPTKLFSGEVTAMEVELTTGGTRTVVRGYDLSHRLYRGRRVESFVNQKPADIVRAKAGGVGLQMGSVEAAGGVLEHVAQAGVSDWALLQRLAVRTGAVLAVKEGKLEFRRATSASTAPGGANARRDPLVLEKGVNLVSLRACVSAADQVPSVEVRSWDVKQKKAIIGTATAGTTSATVDGLDPGKLAKVVKAPPLVEARTTQPDQQGCTTMATAIADRIGGTHAELEGMARGNPKLRAGAAVSLAGVGKPFNGSYTLTSTRHEFGADRGYLTAFTVSNTSDRTAYGLATAGGSEARSGRMHGVAVGVVSDVKDKERLGRVRVTFPALSDNFVSTWARTLQPGAGKGRGWVILPEVGDEVLVAFGLGDFEEPYVLGGLYNGKDLPTVPMDKHVDGGTGSIVRRAFVSRTGMLLELLEEPGKESITLSTHDGKQRVTLVQKADAAIEIVSEGPVTVTAKKDVKVATSGGNIALESSSGDITLKGMNVTIDAKTDCAIKGVNVKLTAQAAGELTGATVKVAGQGTAELSASGSTTVRGALVKIN
ncbi:VgrG-related protein [Knoellia aerolata]|uniref:Type IV secretion protein Rhs n=1 Tax=Knoellia aerolata DSM 18566 TaxID=1385519 RepID=A0A0A0JX46_9MICO|nr:VgrG-related protein [Knoellia aerolata]KGN41284.1 type IV secretion protein Rhs [Knoellia aerolata DSM 18566]